MLFLPLEPTDDRANPQFKDVPGCAKWLAQLQLTNMQVAHSQLLTQISELNRYPMNDVERFKTLEHLRETVAYVQDAYAKKLVGKPLPLSDSELLVFFAVVQLWHELVLGYQRCLQSHAGDDHKLDKHAALLCQRCLLYSGLEIFEYLRTRYAFDAKLWHQLHALYAFVEAHNFQAMEVADPLNSKYPHSSCHSIYIKTLLACHARPAELSRAQLQLLDTWLAQWSSTVVIERSFVMSHNDAQPLALDMASTQGLKSVKFVQHSDTVRYLAMVEISKLLRVKTILLQQGKTPQQLDLGDHSKSSECISFLTFLHQCWCEERTRSGERPPVTQAAQICFGMEHIYAQLSGKRFKSFGLDASVDREARNQIETFGRVLHGKPTENAPLTETWNFENANLLGAQLTRKDLAGGRLNSNQLIAMRADNADIFTLGITVWARVLHAGQLQIGVRYLPGTVEAISICTAGLNKVAINKFVPAFLLHAIPSLNIPPSLIIPRDWFQPGRVVEVVYTSTEAQHVKLGISVERGVDFERVSFG